MNSALSEPSTSRMEELGGMPTTGTSSIPPQHLCMTCGGEGPVAAGTIEEGYQCWDCYSSARSEDLGQGIPLED